MASPRPDHAPPVRIVLCALALVVLAGFGPRFAAVFRPPDGWYLDFCQEWLSARNYLDGTPVYADQAEALARHTGRRVGDGQFILPWNAHPPAAVVLTLPFGKLSYRDAHFAWNLVTFPLFLLSLGLVLRELGVPLTLSTVLPLVALVVVFNPLMIHLMQGQPNIPILLLLTLAWLADRHDRPGWAGVAAGLAAGLKLSPAFVFVYFLFARRWRALLTGGLAFLAVNGVALALFGPDEFGTYVRDVIPSLLPYQSSWRNVSLTGFWLRLFDPSPREKLLPLVLNPTLGHAMVLACRVLVTAAVAWAAWRADSTAGRDRAFAAALVGMILVSPVAWTHYFVLLVLPVGLVWVRLPGGFWRGVMWPVLAVLWMPDTLFAMLAVGREEAVALANLEHQPLGPAVSLTALSAFTYALVGLFVLVLLTPADGREGNHEPAGRGA